MAGDEAIKSGERDGESRIDGFLASTAIGVAAAEGEISGEIEIEAAVGFDEPLAVEAEQVDRGDADENECADRSSFASRIDE